MDLATLKTDLEGRGSPLTLAANDATLPQELRTFLEGTEGKQVTWSTSTVLLQGSSLSVSGPCADAWAVQGFDGVTVTFTDFTLTIDDGGASPTFDGVANATLPITPTVGVPVTVTALHEEASPWRIALAADAQGVTPTELLMLGRTRDLPFDVPTNLNLLDHALTVDQSAFDIRFYPNTTFEAFYTFRVSAPQASWTLIEGVLAFDGIDLDAHIMTSSMSAVLTGHVVIDGIGVDVGVAFDAGEDWEVFVKPTDGDAFPGLLALASWIGGSELSGEASAGFDNVGFDRGAFDLALERVALGFNWKTRNLNYLDITSLLTIGALELDVSLRLPDLEVIGTLHDGNPVKVADMLTSFGLAADDVPDDLAISEVSFDAEPRAGTYLAGMTVENVWAVGPVSFEEIGVHVAYDKADGFTGHFDGTIRLGDAARLGLDAEYQGPEGGWRFEGRLSQEPGKSIGDLLTELAGSFGVDGTPPAPLAGVELRALRAAFATKPKDFTFNAEVDFPVAGKEVALIGSFELKHYGDSDYVRTVSGELTVGTLVFDVVFAKSNTETSLVASYADKEGTDINVGALLEHVTDNEGVVDLGRNIDFNLKDAVFAYKTGATAEAPNDYLFGLDMGFGINLSGLPLVGKALPKDASLRLMMQPLVASRRFDETEVRSFRALIPQGGTPLPDKAIESGLNLAISLRVGDQPIDLSFPLGINKDTGKVQETTGQAPGGGAAAAGKSDGVKWFDIQKSLGPVHLNRVGVKYADSELSFLLDGSLSAAGLTLSLYGLSARSPIDHFDPRFSLDGLGLDYSNASVEIGGALLHRPDSDPDEYDGAAVVRAGEWSLAAIGSYAYVDGHPSLFVYAVLSTPLGGPAFFFVTGVAFGFGYNRALVVPPIEGVKTFPLVAEALSPTEADSGSTPGGDAAAKINGVVAQLGDAVPPTPGQYFVAAGIKFTSFKLVDSFALVAVSFGEHFEIDLLGISTAVIPTPDAGKDVPAIAEIQMVFKVTFDPEGGFLSARAQLTPASFLLSRDCHLTGGFAFSTWFNERSGHNGDFVLTLGGYHPHFDVPAHYPTVPRLGFNWRISEQLSIKGDAYFALTPVAVMAGGHLDATWKDGSLEAWFRAGADFLLAWKPYHYEAEIYLDMGVKYTFHLFGTHHLSLELGADLSIWGPEFSGKATVHLWIISFTVHFGHTESPKPVLLEWTQFKDSFLPQPNDVCSLMPRAGLVRTIPADKDPAGHERWVVNPKDLSILVNSAIPMTQVAIGETAANELSALRYRPARGRSGRPIIVVGAEAAGERTIRPFVANEEQTGFEQLTEGDDATLAPGALGVGTMGIRSTQEDLSSTLNVEIRRNATHLEHHFGFVPALKNVPAALWGDESSVDVNADALIQDAVTGFEIVPRETHSPGVTRPVDRRNLQYAVDGVNDSFHYEADRPLASSPTGGRGKVQSTIKATAQAKARRELLEALGVHNPEGEMSVSDTVAAALLKDPEVALVGPPSPPV